MFFSGNSLELKSHAPRRELVEAQVEALTRPEKELATLTKFETNFVVLRYSNIRLRQSARYI